MLPAPAGVPSTQATLALGEGDTADWPHPVNDCDG
jgi:hypothetical protein